MGDISYRLAALTHAAKGYEFDMTKNSNANESTPSDSGQWFVKVTFKIEELNAIHAILDRIHKECLFGAGVDVWLAPGGCPCVDDQPMCGVTEDDPILSPDDENIDAFDTAVDKLNGAIEAHKHQISMLNSECDSAQAELMQQQPTDD